MEQQLTCLDLSLGYDHRAIVEHLCFSVSRGDYICVVGQNGAGKSTLIKTLLGFLPPISGAIKRAPGVRLGYLPQQSAIQRDFPATVGEIVLTGCLGQRGLRPFYSTQEKRLAHSAMERMSILSLARHSYRELSGGQQQRVLLARALCAAGDLLILDEPVTGLDPKAAAELYALIRDLNVTERISMLMVTHDLPTAFGDATHVLHIKSAPVYNRKDDYLNSALGKRTLEAAGGER